MDINIKGIDSKIGKKLTAMASDRGFRSRTEFVSLKIKQIANNDLTIVKINEILKSEIALRTNSADSLDIAIAKKVEQDLKRYYDLINRGQFGTKPFYYEEAVLLVRIFNGAVISFDIDPKQYLQLSIRDYLEINSDKKPPYIRGRRSLDNAIESLTSLQSAYVLDAIECFWASAKKNYKSDREMADDLIKCGLTTQEHVDEYYGNKP